MRSPVPQEVSDELRRLVGRWHQLPLGQALSHVPDVLGLARALADDAARASGRAPAELPVLPDLGPAAVMDQLAVLVWDACAAGAGGDVRDRLVALRRAL